MPTLAVNNIDLYYETHGEGNPLLLVAGLASDSQSWQTVMERLASRFLVITMDNRGVGRTQPLDCTTSINLMADDCMTLVRHLGFSSVNLLGHSMGGFVAQDFAIRYPASVERLVLAGTLPANSKRNKDLFGDWASCLDQGVDPELWFRNIFFWIFSPRFFEDERAVAEALRFAVEYPYPQSPIAFRNQVLAIAGFNPTGVLPLITARTLVLAGTEDLLFPPQECAGFAQQLPHAAFKQIDKAAHAIHMENPQAFTEAVLNFLFDR
jgi:pimeloyl-ACP methyl ester carboxylesterase